MLFYVGPSSTMLDNDRHLVTTFIQMIATWWPSFKGQCVERIIVFDDR